MHSDFSSFGNVSIACWFHALPGEPVSAWSQVSSSAMLWGAGTALGEVPPYALSYHAAKAGQQNEELDKMFGMQSTDAEKSLIGGIVVRMKNWMLDFIKRSAGGHHMLSVLTSSSSFSMLMPALLAQLAL